MWSYLQYLLQQIDLEDSACWSILCALCVIQTAFGSTLHACVLWASFAVCLIDFALLARSDHRSQQLATIQGVAGSET